MMKLLPLKFNTKSLLAVMICLSVIYSSCRKSENNPASSTKTEAVNTEAQSSAVALNLAQSLAGNFGGVNIMDGVDSVSLTGHQGPHHSYSANALCGFFTDSVVNWDHNYGDTVAHVGGNLTFYFSCKDGKPNGYTAYDSLASTKTTPKGSNQYYVKQYYTIKCLDDKHQFVGVDGDIYYYNSVVTLTSCDCHPSYTDVYNANYVLTGLTVDVCKKDVLSGTATFKAYGPSWSLTGTITFLGNHLADVLINGKVYHVNMLTHVVS